MEQIPPIDDNYIDSIIKSAGLYRPELDKTQGVKLRELVKLMRDRLEQEIVVSKFNPIAGNGIILSGSYPDITFGSSASIDDVPIAGSVNAISGSGVFNALASKSGLAANNVFGGYNTFGLNAQLGTTPVTTITNFGNGSGSRQYLLNGGSGTKFNQTLAVAAQGSTIYQVLIGNMMVGGPQSTTGINTLGPLPQSQGLVNGTYTVATTTNGAGKDAMLTVEVRGNIISDITLSVIGTTYAAGNTLTFAIPNTAGGTTSLTIAIATVGGINYTYYGLGVNGDAIVNGILTSNSLITSSTVSARGLTNYNGNNITLGPSGSVGTLYTAADNEMVLLPSGTATNSARLQVGGIAYGNGGFSRGFTNFATLRPSQNNDILIGNDFSATYETGTTAVQTYTYTTSGNATSSGTNYVNFTPVTGSGSGIRIFVTTTLGSNTVVMQIGNGRRGTGFAVGDTAKASFNGVTITLTITTIGLTGISAYAARFNNNILLNYLPSAATSTGQFLVRETNGVITQSSLKTINGNSLLGSGDISNVIINTTITSVQTSASLNSLYPVAFVGQQVTAPNNGMKYEKVSATDGGRWISWAVTTI